MKASIKKIEKPQVGKNVGVGFLTIIDLAMFAVAFLILLRAIFRKKPAPTKYIDSRGYVVLSQVNELEHRYIAKQKVGRELEPNEVVHHVNGKKTDNRIWNLCLMDKDKHEHFHSWLRWKKEKNGRYPSFADQERVLENEYGGTLLQNLRPTSRPEPDGAQLYLLKAETPCWKCKEASSVVALGVGLRNVSLDNDFRFFILSNITRVPKDIYSYLCQFTPRYKVTFSKEAGTSYFMNHCERCDAPFGDAYLHKGTTFSPTTEEDARSVQMIKLDFPVYYSVQIPEGGKSQRRFEGFECAYRPGESIWKFSERGSRSG